jgi:hypothetical protein
MTRAGMASLALLLVLPSAVSAQASGANALACVQRVQVSVNAHIAATLRYTNLLASDAGGATHMSPATCAAPRQAVAAGNNALRHMGPRPGCPTSPRSEAATAKFAASLRPLAVRYQSTCRAGRAR